MMNGKLTKRKTLPDRKAMLKKYSSIFIFLFSYTAVFAQTNLSTSENYIYTKICLDADCIKKAEVVQYYDGLGRPVQTVGIKATPLGKDVVTPVEYNSLGKQVKDYLPIPQSGTSGGVFYATPFDGVPAAYGTEKIYSEKIYDNVYTDRVKQVISVGDAWKLKPVNLGYDTNTAGEVKKYSITTNWLDGRTDSQITLSTPYAANQLMKTSATDEDGNTTVEFQNGEGQTVLVRKNDGTQNVDTYYLYNEYGQLAYVIPPLAISNAAPDQTTLDNLCYQYRYDGMGKLVEKKIPGKGWEYIIYDKQDRVIMTQDANLRTTTNNFGAKGWMFTKYDKFGRMVYTGFFPSADTRSSVQNTVNNISVNPENNETRSTGSFTSNGMDIYYSQNAFPSANVTVLSVNYYDTYPPYTFNPTFPTSVFGSNVITDSQNSAINTKALPTLSLVKNIEDNNWTKSYVWYDEKARPVFTYSINHLGGYTKTESELDFAGVLKQTKAYHKRLSSDTEKVITQTFEYDGQNRIKKVWHQVGSNPQELLSENIYNELSQLSNKKIGNNLQSIDYTYNIRGSLVKVNDPANLGTKLFGYELKYFNPQNTTGSTGKYNGNIAEVTWKTASDNVLRRYNYQYDVLGRLTKGIYSEPEASVPQNNFYNETVAYDMNSNILSLQRNAKGITGATEQIDNLTYAYTGNKLNAVSDISGNYSGYPDVSGIAITYDSNGNMENHKDKGILEIKYNFLNLPNAVKFDKTYIPRFPGQEIDYNVNTKYLFRADGEKLRKTYTYGTGKTNLEVNKITEYLDGFQYEMEDTGGFISNMPLKFVPTSEGYYNFENNKYIYSYTDHLGNVRLSYFNNGSGAEVLEENDFYPFGLKHNANSLSSGNPSYNYQYNGKELQKETGWSDYGARMYMADIGRWGVIDPLAEMMRRYSPYNYAYNNPISYIDPDGRKPLPQEDEIKATMVPTTMLMFYASGGSTNNRALMEFVGQPDDIGAFFVAMDKLNSVNSKSGGGGASIGGDPTPKKNDGPGIIQRIGNFFSNLFGGKKKEATIEVGQLESIPLEEKNDMSWSIVLGLLFGNADPYSAIGNAGVGPYVEERETAGMAAMLFINPEAAAEGLERKALSKAAMSKIWGAGLDYELKTVLHPGTLEKTIEKAWGKDAVGAFDNIIDQLAKGKAGGNIHSLGKELKGYKAIDMPGTGTGRGAGRIIFKEAPNQVEIIGVVKGHDYTKILK